VTVKNLQDSEDEISTGAAKSVARVLIPVEVF